ncbi:polysaccharide pyruvyl transferase family protein [Pseudobutyrivibrio sp. MD2005]|uniref:polysaccharide pyruvyl transferase family protein n=1 Tax=Pseudobutyrivibrio sp. MD2005 TaxID=1410616 RepID=UPI000482DED5|nr:polysaccharide pyruvyl transferase family protein [Pseudobutyrivibrio sp. MD2005]
MKIGIITMYYNSSNYGGILQAYALTEAIKKMGIDSEQICYNHYSAFSAKRRLKMRLNRYLPIMKNPINIYVQYKINRRTKIIVKDAKKLVPHSKNVFGERNIKSCVLDYDVFITGSDQVWHGDWPAYFLDFVPNGIKKIAYAASTGKSFLTKKEIDYIKEKTESYTAISVRENDIKDQLSKSMKQAVKWVLDPTLILDRQDWEDIVSNKKNDKPYMFCYFLGRDKRIRDLAKAYACEHNIEIITIPHMQGRVESVDLGFGDMQLFDTTVEDFLSYIKYARIVFTDSFHASVFSHIFETQFVCFGRSEHKEMNNRMISLTQLFGTENHFIHEEKDFNIDYIKSMQNIDYTIVRHEYNLLKRTSLRYLYDSIMTQNNKSLEQNK